MIPWENINVYSKSQSKLCFLRNKNQKNSEITTEISGTVSITKDQILFNG
jgi:urate oxidase